MQLRSETCERQNGDFQLTIHIMDIHEQLVHLGMIPYWTRDQEHRFVVLEVMSLKHSGTCSAACMKCTLVPSLHVPLSAMAKPAAEISCGG